MRETLHRPRHCRDEAATVRQEIRRRPGENRKPAPGRWRGSRELPEPGSEGSGEGVIARGDFVGGHGRRRSRGRVPGRPHFSGCRHAPRLGLFSASPVACLATKIVNAMLVPKPGSMKSAAGMAGFSHYVNTFFVIPPRTTRKLTERITIRDRKRCNSPVDAGGDDPCHSHSAGIRRPAAGNRVQ